MQNQTNIPVTLNDFKECGWKEAISGLADNEYMLIFDALFSASRKAMEESRASQGRALQLLAAACSMMLSPQSPNEPFKPFSVLGGRRSAAPDDFSDDDILLFSQFASDVDNAWIRARLADLVWVNKRSLGINFALMAIDAYRLIPLDENVWTNGGEECWKRALALSRMLAKGAEARLSEMETDILSSLNSAQQEGGFLILWLADLLYEYGLGKSQGRCIAEKLEHTAHVFGNKSDFHKAREYFAASAKWYKDIADDEKLIEVTMGHAEIFVQDALYRISSAEPSHMAAAHCYERAIHLYRSIPKTRRGAWKVDERLEKLKKEIGKSREKSIDEMGEISVPGPDLSEAMVQAQNAVSGKIVTDALKNFTNLCNFFDYQKNKDRVSKLIPRHLFHVLFPSNITHRTGRIVAKVPGWDFKGDPANNNLIINAELVKNYGILVSMRVRGLILPAKERLLQEHHLRERDFVGIAAHSPIVPPHRSLLMGKALFAGYDNDFATCIHLLAPQVENIVRYYLKKAGAKTTTLDSNGIQTENGLSSLIDMPQVVDCFGEDISFEIKALFCDACGANLRNKLAHGLLDDLECYSEYAVYAWWFCLKLVFNSFWNVTQSAEEAPDPEDSLANWVI